MKVGLIEAEGPSVKENKKFPPIITGFMFHYLPEVFSGNWAHTMFIMWLPIVNRFSATDIHFNYS